jgi:CDP-diacylglycerol--glycerol-3-phosphate 3-phosphatidyltransferase
MKWTIPNQLTVARIGLAGGFFVLLGQYGYGTAGTQLLMNIALGVYIVAGITDVLDGWIARKWNLTSAFGRIVDPFVDKVLVVGAFVMFTGSNFALRPGQGQSQDVPDAALAVWLTGRMLSGVQAWMVVAILAREFVVSAVRGYSESQGIKFPANSAGKIKMAVQSVAICLVLFQLGNFPGCVALIYAKVALVWAAMIVTVLSGLVYVGKARKLLGLSGEK